MDLTPRYLPAPVEQVTIGLDRVPALFVRPASAEPCPAVLLQHGYGVQKSDFLPLATILATCGFATLLPNAWGHGGVASAQEHMNRLRELEGLLATTQACVASSFETWDLLKPHAATYADGTFNYTVTLLTGTNPAFRKMQVQVCHPLDSGRLYLLCGGTQRGLELVPLLRVIASQDSGDEACYFYSRLMPENGVFEVNRDWVAD